VATTKPLTARKKLGQNAGDPNAAGDTYNPSSTALMREIENISRGKPGRLQEMVAKMRKFLGLDKPAPKKK
jgi:hypothetical protein